MVAELNCPDDVCGEVGRRFSSLVPSRMTRGEFVAAFGNIFESSPWAAERAWEMGIDESCDEIPNLHKRMAAAVRAASAEMQMRLIASHPQLAASSLDSLGELSRREQQAAGLAAINADESRRFAELNAAYRAKFGFPFVMAIEGRDKAEIFAAFEQRLNADRENECHRALEEVIKIAGFRLHRL